MQNDNLEIKKSDDVIIVDNTDKVGSILKKYNLSVEFITDDTILAFADVVSAELGLALPSALSEIRAYLLQIENPDILSTHMQETIGIIKEGESNDTYIPNLNAVTSDIEFPVSKFDKCAACGESVENEVHTYCLECQLPVHAKCGYKSGKQHFCSEKCVEIFINNTTEQIEGI